MRGTVGDFRWVLLVVVDVHVLQVLLYTSIVALQAIIIGNRLACAVSHLKLLFLKTDALQHALVLNLIHMLRVSSAFLNLLFYTLL